MIDWETFKAQLLNNPKKALKSVILLAGCLLLIWILVILQTGSPAHQNTVKVNDSGKLSGLNLSSHNASDSLGVKESSKSTQPILQDGPDSGLYILLPTALIFILVVGGIWLWIRSKNSSASGKISGEVFTTIASQKIPGGQQLLVIKLNGEYWVIATGGTQGVTLLHRYSSEEWKTLRQDTMEKNERSNFWQTLKTTASEND